MVFYSELSSRIEEVTLPRLIKPWYKVGTGGLAGDLLGTCWGLAGHPFVNQLSA